MEEKRKFMFSDLAKLVTVLLFGLAALIAEFAFKEPKIAFWIMVVAGALLIIDMVIDMIETFRSGMYGVDILAVTAILATLFVGEYWATFMLAVMITGGGALEEYANGRASRELESLLDNNPQSAHLYKDNDLVDVEVDEVKVGDTILVRANELVPVDGTLVDEYALLDQSQLTGESLPVTVNSGDEVLSGALNQEKAFKLKVSKTAENSSYQQLVKLVEESKERPSNFVKISDRYSIPFTIIAYVIAFAAWIISGDVIRFAEVLVVASPCPLLLSAPIAMISGMSRSSANGIIVKSGTTLEKMARAKTVAFDKTGTITSGQLKIQDLVLVDSSFSKAEVLQYAAAVEKASAHVLARSLVEAAEKEKLSTFSADNVEEITSQGVRGTVKNKLVKVGKAKFADFADYEDSLDDNIGTSVFVSIDNKPVAYVNFADVIRPESQATIARLQKYGLKDIMMLTGDREEIAEKIAKEAGVPEFKAELLPQDKIDTLDQIPEKNRPVIMVGDGVNDAPALAAAEVGIAMGAHGATAASETADAVIVKDDLAKVADLMGISTRTLSVAKQSVLIGIFLSIALMVVAAFGVIPAFWGAVLQECLDMISMVLALRARKAGKKEY